MRAAGKAHDLPSVLLFGGCAGSRAVLAKALLDEALAAGCATATPDGPVDCSAPEDRWRPLLREAWERAGRSPVTSLLAGDEERRVAVVTNVDAVGCASHAGSQHGGGSSMAAESFVKSCVETTPGCWWILTAAGHGRVSAGLLSNLLCLPAAPRLDARPGRGRGRAESAEGLGPLGDACGALMARGDSAGARGLDDLVGRARKAVDASISRGAGDRQILDEALGGMMAACKGRDGARRALVQTFAEYGARIAGCRRSVWKGGLFEQAIIEAFVRASDELHPSASTDPSDSEAKQQPSADRSTSTDALPIRRRLSLLDISSADVGGGPGGRDGHESSSR